ncbi:SDR family oxidoreductase [Sinorhizobium chiapasense]|uniref:SDR family oxidoreductase n=1 Tax=Sinorhizobium chiapasense TaxID=501572 RepID=A0ABZ2B7G0_9HYPH
MNILILGATGFIGSAIAKKLVNDGHRVTGLSRDPSRAALTMPALQWIRADLAGMTRGDWQGALTGHEIVVNCAGALQDGLSDDLVATQEKSMLALYEAARDSGLRLVVQISAETESAGSDLPFLATKRRADAALASSGLPFVILRPALVLGRNAHGGSALLRALAALPFAIPLIHAGSPVATVALDDVAGAVSAAVNGDLPAGSDLALGNDEHLTLKDLVLIHRHWLGLPPAPAIALPPTLARPVTWLADVAGLLGWRSPLRSTAMMVMSGGIASRPSADFRPRLVSAAENLAAAPSGVQDLWFARLYLLKPLIVVALSLFWVISGLVPFFAFDAASTHFAVFLPEPLASAATIATCLADIALGLAVLVRPWARRALLGMLLLTLAYLLAATLAEPTLWRDPLGPLVKVLPSILLTLTALAILDER